MLYWRLQEKNLRCTEVKAVVLPLLLNLSICPPSYSTRTAWCHRIAQWFCMCCLWVALKSAKVSVSVWVLGISCWQTLCTITVEKYLLYMNVHVLQKVCVAQILCHWYLFIFYFTRFPNCSAMEWNVSNAKKLFFFFFLIVHLTDVVGKTSGSIYA